VAVYSYASQAEQLRNWSWFRPWLTGTVKRYLLLRISISWFQCSWSWMM